MSKSLNVGTVFTPSPDQQAVINHDPAFNGRVLAGPGTGKSSTALALIGRLAASHPDLQIRMLTFTRAATAELAKKIGDTKLDIAPPSTIHSFALGLLLRNPGTSNLPEPLRIPDECEVKALIHPDIARRLRNRGFRGFNVGKVGQFEREMAAGWQSLDPNAQLLSDAEPELRSAYVGQWGQHRRIFGYTLLSELPFRAGHAFEDFDLRLDPLDLLVVDEYQDLNEADIRLIRLIAKKGSRVLAIGDDDQSIYGFREAAPEGILRFPDEFTDCKTYELTTSHRCSANILKAAMILIHAAPDRPPKKPLTFNKEAQPGRYLYLRFPGEVSENNGVADLINLRLQAGVPPSEIAIVVRSRTRTWATALIPALAKRNIDAIDIDWFADVFEGETVRKGLALIRLALHKEDSLAWWTLLSLQKGVGQSFIDYIYDSVGSEENLGQAILRLHPDFSNALSVTSAKAAARLVQETVSLVEQVKIEGAELGEAGWGGWIIEQLNSSRLSNQAVRLFKEVGRAVPPDQGLGYFLGQLEPVAKDLATQSNAVRIMSMSASKGLTVNTCIVMGVEKGNIPHPRSDDEDEERRLLYVAMTRATDMCVFTFANRRKGPTARHGTVNVNRSRGRSTLLENLPYIGDWQEGKRVIDQLRQEVSI